MEISKLYLTIRDTIPSVYTEGMSFLEILESVVAKLNEVIDATSTQPVDVRSVVEDMLAGWKDDGTISTLLDALGITGPTGPAGADGADGSNGADGADGADAPNVQIQYSVDGATSWHSTATGSDEYMRFSTDGGSTWGAAVHFKGETGATGATGAAGESAADVAEDDFTPTFYGASTAGTTTYNVQRGRYYRIGSLVFITIYVGIASASGTGDVRIGGLPFNISSNWDAPVMRARDNYVSYGVYDHFDPTGIPGTKTLNLYGSQSGGAWGARTMDMFPDGCALQFSGTYITDDAMPE